MYCVAVVKFASPAFGCGVAVLSGCSQSTLWVFAPALPHAGRRLSDRCIPVLYDYHSTTEPLPPITSFSSLLLYANNKAHSY